MKNNIKNLKKYIIEQSKRAGVGHIGSALSIIDLLWCIYDKHLIVSAKKRAQNDRFILSKGHAALALYVVLYAKGFISEKDLNTYCADNSTLGVHPEHYVNGIDFATGSLGQGITFAVGAALGAKIEESSRRVYCVLSDAELNEGSFWEAIMFAAQHKLNNLVYVLDDNKQQALGFTKDVIQIRDLSRKIESFGFNVYTIDGHDIDDIDQCLKKTKICNNSKPHFIIANTICGKGVSYMEGTIEWHYKSMNDDQYQQALKELS